MSNKVYYIQPATITYNMRQPTRQTVYPHIAKPQRIVPVIKNKPLPQSDEYEEDIIDSDYIEMDSPHQKPQRRRERLNHLSQAEKLNRRKMKNREAAQNARDRKKVQSRKMEDTIRHLVAENRRLRAENTKLRANVSRLTGADCQQQQMPQQQHQYIPETHLMSSVALSENSSSPNSTVESAELRRTSLPWIRDAMNSILSVKVSRKCTQQMRPSIKARRTMVMHQSKNGTPSKLIRILMLLMNQSYNMLRSNNKFHSNNTSTIEPSRPTMTLSKVHSSTNFALNLTNGATTRVLLKKWKPKRRLSSIPRSTIKRPMR